MSRLRHIAAREVWPDEARDFTPWLLANVDVLADLLGMDLVLEQAEYVVGDFRLDLIGRDDATGDVVIVENQLDGSDHSHLGQLLTYAAGTDPTTIVWIASRFRPEHRAAIAWLNERTDERTRVFGVAIKVVRIDDSAYAPAFELVEQPNDWEKDVRRATTRAPATGARQGAYREYWEQLLDVIRSQHPQWTRARTSNQTWCDTNLGLAGVKVSMSFRREGLAAHVYFSSPDAALNAARFDLLARRRSEFETALGRPASWDPMDGRIGARVGLISTEPWDVTDRAAWAQMNAWLLRTQVALRAAVDAAGGVAALSAVSYAPADDL